MPWNVIMPVIEPEIVGDDDDDDREDALKNRLSRLDWTPVGA